jgi:hypothetical protein
MKKIARLTFHNVLSKGCGCCGTESSQSVGVLENEDGSFRATYIAREIMSPNGREYKLYILLTDEELIPEWGHSISVVLQRNGDRIEFRLVNDPGNPYGSVTGKRGELITALTDHAREIANFVMKNDPYVSLGA